MKTLLKNSWVCSGGHLESLKLLELQQNVRKGWRRRFNSVPGYHISKQLTESRLVFAVRSQSATFPRDPVRFMASIMALLDLTTFVEGEPRGRFNGFDGGQ